MANCFCAPSFLPGHNDAAVREDLIVYGEDGSIAFKETARETLSRHFTTQILQLLVTAARTLADSEQAALRPAVPDRVAAESIA